MLTQKKRILTQSAIYERRNSKKNVGFGDLPLRNDIFLQKMINKDYTAKFIFDNVSLLTVILLRMFLIWAFEIGTLA